MTVNKKTWIGGELVSQSGLNQTSNQDAVNSLDNIHIQYGNVVASAYSHMKVESGQPSRTLVARANFIHVKPASGQPLYRFLIRAQLTAGGTLTINTAIKNFVDGSTEQSSLVTLPVLSVTGGPKIEYKTFNEPSDFSFGGNSTGSYELLSISSIPVGGGPIEFQLTIALIALNQ